MRTYLVATAAITGFYPGLVQAQSINPSGMSIPNYQVESLLTGNEARGPAQVFLIPRKPTARLIADDSQTVKPVITADNMPAPQK
jgi:hypothetical protein